MINKKNIYLLFFLFFTLMSFVSSSWTPYEAEEHCYIGHTCQTCKEPFVVQQTCTRYRTIPNTCVSYLKVPKTCTRYRTIPKTCSGYRNIKYACTKTRTVSGICYGPRGPYNCPKQEEYEGECSYSDYYEYDCSTQESYEEDCSYMEPYRYDCSTQESYEEDCSYIDFKDYKCNCECNSPTTSAEINTYNNILENLGITDQGYDDSGNYMNCGENIFNNDVGYCTYSQDNCKPAGYEWNSKTGVCGYSETQCIAIGGDFGKNGCEVSVKDCEKRGGTVTGGFCKASVTERDCINNGYLYNTDTNTCRYTKTQCIDQGYGWLSIEGYSGGGRCSVKKEDCPTSYFYNNICYSECPNFNNETQVCYSECPKNKEFNGKYCTEIITISDGTSNVDPCIPKTKEKACGNVQCGQTVSDGCFGNIICGPCTNNIDICMPDYKCCTPYQPDTHCGDKYGTFNDGCTSNYSCVCNGISECAHDDKCYSSGTILDSDKNGDLEICSYSKWKDLSLRVDFVFPTPYNELWVSKFDIIKANINQSFFNNLIFYFNKDVKIQINLSSLIFGASFDSGTDFFDWINNKEIISHGDISWEQNGIYGGALYFDGTGDYLNILGWNNRLDNDDSKSVIDDGFKYNIPNKEIKNSFSFGAWIKATETHEIDTESIIGTSGTSGQKYIFEANHGGENAGAGLSVGTNGISVYEHGSSYMPASAVYEGNLGTNWNYIMIIYDNKKPKIYLNGELVKTGPLPSIRSNVYAPTSIGSGYYGSFKGNVDEVRIFDRALSPEEVKSLYLSNIKKTSEDKWEFSVPMNSSNMSYDYKEYNITVCDPERCDSEKGFFYLVENNVPTIKVVELNSSVSNEKIFNITNIGDVSLSYEAIDILVDNKDIIAMKNVLSSSVKNSENPKVIKKGDSYLLKLVFNYSNVTESGKIIFEDYTTMELSENSEQLYISYGGITLNFILDNEIFYKQKTNLMYYVDCLNNSDSKFLIGEDDYYCSCNSICKKGKICPCLEMFPASAIHVLRDGYFVRIFFDARKTGSIF